MIIGLLIMIMICIDVLKHKEIDGDIYWSQFATSIFELLIFDPLVIWLVTLIV